MKSYIAKENFKWILGEQEKTHKLPVHVLPHHSGLIFGKLSVFMGIIGQQFGPLLLEVLEVLVIDIFRDKNSHQYSEGVGLALK